MRRTRAGALRFRFGICRVGQRLDLVALGIRGFDVRFQFALFAFDFLLLQLDHFLLFDDLHLHFFGLHELAGLEFLQIVGEVGFGYFLVHRGLITRDVGLIIALRLGNLGVGGELGFLAGLRGLRGFDHRVPVGFGLRDLRVPFDLGYARFAEGFEVALAVADVADGEADDPQAHVRHVARGNFLDLRREGVAIL